MAMMREGETSSLIPSKQTATAKLKMSSTQTPHSPLKKKK